jgi:DNA-binding NarL/FixJ family response regulator
MTEIKVLIVEDEPIISAQIELFLEQNGFEVSGIAYTFQAATALLKSETIDIVLLDINLGETATGIDLAQYINSLYQLPFIYITSYSDKNTLDKAKHTQPYGYLVKPFNEANLIASIEIALFNFAQRFQQHTPKLDLSKINKKLLSPITEREFDIIQLVFEGLTNDQIAQKLFISTHTIKQHLKSIFSKMDVGSRTQLLAKCAKG